MKNLKKEVERIDTHSGSFTINKNLEKVLKENFRADLIFDSVFCNGEPAVTIPIEELKKMFDVCKISPNEIANLITTKAERAVSTPEFIQDSIQLLKDYLFPTAISKVVEKEDKVVKNDDF